MIIKEFDDETTKHDEVESWALSMRTTKTRGDDHSMDTPGYRTLGWYINEILKHFKGDNKEELIAALRTAAITAWTWAKENRQSN
jgi:hypothetical protein